MSSPKPCAAEVEAVGRLVLDHLADGRWHDIESIPVGSSKRERRNAIWALESKGTKLEYKREDGRSFYRLPGDIAVNRAPQVQRLPRVRRNFKPVGVVEPAANEAPTPEAKAIMSRLWVKAPLSEYSSGELMSELASRGWELSPRRRWVSEPLPTSEESD